MIKSPYHDKEAIAEAIANKKVIVERRARQDADDWFGWKKDHICAAILALPKECCYKSELKKNNPSLVLDFYRALNVNGEDFFTHFYMEDGYLIIDSFKG